MIAFAEKLIPIRRLVLAVIALCAWPVLSNGAADLPAYRGHVNDFAGVIGTAEASRMEGLLRQVKEKTGLELAVATVPSLEGSSVEDYATALFRQWGIGQKKENSGLLLLVAPNDRKYRIEVGYGLEGDLPDSLVGDIGRRMVPYFRQQRYGDGIAVAVDALVAGIAQARGVQITGSERPPSLSKRQRSRGSGIGGVIFFGMLVVFIVIIAVSASGRGRWGGPGMRRRRRWGSDWIWYPIIFSGGGSGGFGGSGGDSGSSWGGLGGGGSSGGDFGGFGGGSSGGGGASGDW